MAMEEETLFLAKETDVQLQSERGRYLDSQRRRSNRLRSILSCARMRYVMAFLGFFGMLCAYSLRINISIAIVAMANETVTSSNGTEELEFTSLQDSKVKGQLLGAFFYGYIIGNTPGGVLAQRSGKHVLGFANFVSAIITLLSPWMAQQSMALLIVSRALIGVAMGGSRPALHALWAKWAPAKDRSRLSTISGSGVYAGTVAAMFLSAVLTSQLSWVWAFYFFGILTIIWWVVWVIVVADSPEQHSCISSAEKQFIVSTRTEVAAATSLRDVQWHLLIRSRPVWAIIVAHFCNNWGFYTLLACLPTFIHQTLGVDIEKNGLFAAIPYLALGIVAPVGGQLADYCRARGVSTTKTRKLFNTAGLFGSATFMVAAGYATQAPLAITWLTLAVALGGFAQSGYMVNHLDIAPQFAGLLIGITNTLAITPGFIAPVVAFAIVTAPDDGRHISALRSQWQQVFWIAAVLNYIGALLFIILASGEVQTWAEPTYRTDDQLLACVDGTDNTDSVQITAISKDLNSVAGSADDESTI